jgi:hypothetical protein
MAHGSFINRDKPRHGDGGGGSSNDLFRSPPIRPGGGRGKLREAHHRNRPFVRRAGRAKSRLSPFARFFG